MKSIRSNLVLVFDTETTGVDVNEDRIVQLGAAYYQDGGRLGPPRSMLVNPGMPIPSGASKVHGILDEHVANEPSWQVVGDRFAHHLAKGPQGDAAPLLCGYNAVSYDTPLINAEFDRHGQSTRIDPKQVLDPIIFVRWYYRHWPKRSLEHVAARKGVRLTRAHSADADAMATGEVLMKLLTEQLIPDDWDQALSQQHQMTQALEEEWLEFKHSLYRDRETGELTLGFGKHIGTPLAQVDPSYLNFCLNKFDGLTEATQEAFSRAIPAAIH